MKTRSLSHPLHRSFGSPSVDVRRIVELHFDPRRGSPYWLERERELGIRALEEVHTAQDLDRFGLMNPAALRERSVWDFVPRGLLVHRERFVVADTAGTVGVPHRSLFRDDEFHAAFVAPIVAALEGREPFRSGALWAYVGPSGPHVIGKAVREVCRALGSPDPFSVDFDPRWFKAQRPGSLGRERYLAHVVEQALDIFRREPIEVLFTTTPVALALGSSLEAPARERIRFLHSGGLPVERSAEEALRTLFPNARCLSGYGNSLVGVAPQLEFDERTGPSYYPHGTRLRLRVVRDRAQGPVWPPEGVAYGERGRVLVTRLDPSFLILNLPERDLATRLPPHSDGAARGFIQDGLGDPQPANDVPTARIGLY